MDDITSESYFIHLASGDTLHLKRFFCNPNGDVVFALHGGAGCGAVFYSKSGKGLAPFLARNGFDVFVPDLRGKGDSFPRISSRSTFGVSDTIREDIPMFLGKIQELRADSKQHWIAHSWGGALLMSYIAYFGRNKISSIVFFGSVRRIAVKNFDRYFHVNFLWNILGRLVTILMGYMPTSAFYPKDADESKSFYLQMLAWITGRDWIDFKDGFNYRAALQGKDLPPILHLAAEKDPYLGHYSDIEEFMKEINSKTSSFHMIASKKESGEAYDHVDMLIHPEAVHDIYPLVLKWVTSV